MMSHTLRCFEGHVKGGRTFHPRTFQPQTSFSEFSSFWIPTPNFHLGTLQPWFFFWSCRKIQPQASTLLDLSVPDFSTIKSWTSKLLFNPVVVCFLGLKFRGWSLGLKIRGWNIPQPSQDNKPISHQIMLILVAALIAFQELKFLIQKLPLRS